MQIITILTAGIAARAGVEPGWILGANPGEPAELRHERLARRHRASGEQHDPMVCAGHAFQELRI